VREREIGKTITTTPTSSSLWEGKYLKFDFKNNSLFSK
jgi:hypothetical protein